MYSTAHSQNTAANIPPPPLKVQLHENTQVHLCWCQHDNLKPHPQRGKIPGMGVREWRIHSHYTVTFHKIGGGRNLTVYLICTHTDCAIHQKVLSLAAAIMLHMLKPRLVGLKAANAKPTHKRNRIGMQLRPHGYFTSGIESLTACAAVPSSRVDQVSERLTVAQRKSKQERRRS